MDTVKYWGHIFQYFWRFAPAKSYHYAFIPNISSNEIIFSNSEAFASKLLENLEEILSILI